MKRSLVNLIVDSLAAINIIAMVLTGYILKFPLPPTTNRAYSLWGLSRHEWGAIHAWAGAGLMGIVMIHLYLHWDWIFSMIRRRFTDTKATPVQQRRAGLLTTITLIAIGGLFAWSAHTSVQDSEAPRRHLNRLQSAASVLPTTTAAPQVVTFQHDIQPIFAASCIACHGPGKPRGNFRVDLRESFFSETDTAPLIIPGNSDKSRLISIVSGEVKSMKSAQDHLLPPEELALLKTWIDAGAVWEGE